MEVSVNSTMQEIEQSGQFKQFDIVAIGTRVLDNHYANDKKEKENLGLSKETTKRIMQEWKILENNLPETIYVRAFEERIDLLQAVIIGAQGTPYHDGLFFFDLSFPSDYPSSPPKVYYHSHGLSINPNLYADGIVCLSLLNTWNGSKSERWDEENSTILQVLVSIQALVLNDNPYFNEPLNFEPNPGWEFWDKKAMLYNESTFVRNCKTMLFTLQRPPMHFQELVSWHFRERAHAILVACKAYMEGRARIGEEVIENGSSTSDRSNKRKEFKASMKVVYPRLIGSFHWNGSSVENFSKQLKEEEERAKNEAKVVVKAKYGFKRAFDKVKKILGFKVKKTTK